MMRTKRLSTREDAEGFALRVCRDIGSDHLSGRRCPECDAWAFAPRQGRGALCFVCPYCGHDWLAT